ncbi:MAG: YqgE/AlgH family protein [Actinomycetota bacterium]|nr:YqgE/AlgH family protein [Actinomycetota bacterium]
MSASPAPDRDRQPTTAPLGWAPGAGQDITAGALAVAMPLLTDPNFDHTVIFLLEHSAEGTVGVVLNRPSEVPLQHVLPTWAPLASGSDFFHVGGPCQTDAALCLVRGELLDSRAGIEGGRAELAAVGLKPAAAGIFLADLDVEPVPSAELISDIRVYAGYAGWAAGQLEDEIAEGAWLCLPAHPDDVFSTEPETLWRSVLRRQRGPLAVLCSAPEDPSLN